jgi:hypothetical protein
MTEPNEQVDETLGETVQQVVEGVNQRKQTYDKIAKGRTWVSYKAHNPYYRRLQDDVQRITAFKFYTKPDQDILDIVKSDEMKMRGLRFQNNDTHGQIWALPTTPEGLATADAVDFKLMQLFNKKREADKGQGIG